jgi:methyl-accepting chemotaxis protein
MVMRAAKSVQRMPEAKRLGASMGFPERSAHRFATSSDDGRIGVPPSPRSSKEFGEMTPSEMEEQIKTLNAWAEEISQNLPLFATKEDLKALATKEDLKTLPTKDELKATKDELKSGIEDAKRYTENLIFVTRREIRQVADKVTSMAADVERIAQHLAILTAPKRRKK